MDQLTIRVLDRVSIVKSTVNTMTNELVIVIDREFDTLSYRLRHKLIDMGKAGKLADEYQRAHLRKGFHVSFVGPSQAKTEESVP